MEITAKEKLACLNRELGMRIHVYPQWVDAGKMKAPFAARQIEVMRAIRDDYASLVKTDQGESDQKHLLPLAPADTGDSSP
jgi:hypothetical protein